MAELGDRLSGLIVGIILLLIALDVGSLILTGKARVFRWIGQKAKKAAIAIWRWFWRTLWRAIRGTTKFLWQEIRALFRWLFNENGQQRARGGNP